MRIRFIAPLVSQNRTFKESFRTCSANIYIIFSVVHKIRHSVILYAGIRPYNFSDAPLLDFPFFILLCRTSSSVVVCLVEFSVNFGVVSSIICKVQGHPVNSAATRTRTDGKGIPFKNFILVRRTSGRGYISTRHYFVTIMH